MIFASPDETEQAFHDFGHRIETDPELKQLAWSRRAAVIEALKKCPDVLQVIPSGSLARGTNVGPIHDIDLIVVFRKQDHPDWRGAGSAESALTYTQVTIGRTLQGGLFSLVQDTQLRNHVVNATPSSSLAQVVGLVPGTPPIDVMPAIRVGSRLHVPERLTDRWIETDPERLIKVVATRQRQWSNFDKVVRMIKAWAEHHDLGMKSLAVEAMVLKYLPTPGLFESLSCTAAVARFFEAAARANIKKIVDPTGVSGEIDPKFNYKKLREALRDSAALSRKAIKAERDWEARHSARQMVSHPSVYWQAVFGKDFPKPTKWFWSPQFPDEDPFLGSLRWFTHPADEKPDVPPFRPPDGPTPPDGGDDDRRPPPDGSSYGNNDRRPPPTGGGHPSGGADFTHGTRESASLENVLAAPAQEVPTTPSIFG